MKQHCDFGEKKVVEESTSRLTTIMKVSPLGQTSPDHTVGPCALDVSDCLLHSDREKKSEMEIEREIDAPSHPAPIAGTHSTRSPCPPLSSPELLLWSPPSPLPWLPPEPSSSTTTTTMR